MEDQSSKEGFTPDEPYNPEDEYTPLEEALDAAAAPQPDAPAKPQPDAPAQPKADEPAAPLKAEAIPAETAASKAAPSKDAPQPPKDSYPQPAVWPYPIYGMPYPQPPVQAYYPGYMPPAQPYDPRAGAVPPYPAAQPYVPYPTPAAPPAAFTPPPEPRQSRAEKPATSAATKAFLIILTALMAAMVVAFTFYISQVASAEKVNASQSADPTQPGVTLPRNLRENNGDNGSTDPFERPNSGSVKEFDEEITLLEDKGETQQRDDDNAQTVGSPDPQAKGVTLAELPKDKDDAKYTAQSAYESVCDSVVTVELYENEITDNINDVLGAGTGTIISADGYIITNAHVIQNSKHYIIRVILNSGESYPAKAVGYDTWTDLAVLKIDADNLKPVTFGDSADIVIGQDVIAIGSPGGKKFQNSLTKGVISAVDREISINKCVRYIQSDATISPGNSGGPLCNIYGQVIGINTAKTIAENYEAMTFSIPSATVQEVVNELLHYGYVRSKTRIGFSGYELTAADQQMYGVPAGLVVSTVDPNGALKGTDIRENDIITAIDGENVSSFQDVYAILAKHKPGDKLTLSVYRVE